MENFGTLNLILENYVFMVKIVLKVFNIDGMEWKDGKKWKS